LGWPERVGTDNGIWVIASKQRLLVVRRGRVLGSYRCSTAKAGLSCRENSLCTPTGWHKIAQKVGKGLPRGAVFKARQWTGEVWTSSASSEDAVLSRILRLAGLEQGVNRGPGVDTWGRFIYIHGTNHEPQIGRPASHGCIRLRNRDVIKLFRLVPIGLKVLISP
jgi:UDP-N-acetylmuramate--alanine ligase